MNSYPSVVHLLNEQFYDEDSEDNESTNGVRTVVAEELPEELLELPPEESTGDIVDSPTSVASPFTPPRWGHRLDQVRVNLLPILDEIDDEQRELEDVFANYEGAIAAYQKEIFDLKTERAEYQSRVNNHVATLVIKHQTELTKHRRDKKTAVSRIRKHTRDLIETTLVHLSGYEWSYGEEAKKQKVHDAKGCLLAELDNIYSIKQEE